MGLVRHLEANTVIIYFQHNFLIAKGNTKCSDGGLCMPKLHIIQSLLRDAIERQFHFPCQPLFPPLSLKFRPINDCFRRFHAPAFRAP